MTKKEINEARLIAKFLDIKISDFIWGKEHNLCYGTFDMDYEDVQFFVPKTDWYIIHQVLQKLRIVDVDNSLEFDIITNGLEEIQLCEQIQTYYEGIISILTKLKWYKNVKKQ